ncbi:HAD-IC family P-type ATPase [Microbacterium sp. CnD16-F]|uniref:heavy metal translocating P-type ATPase n=1 Tax=Microbacterium sp. CnD16-F TaxID=2954493 RepID=UPI0020973317
MGTDSPSLPPGRPAFDKTGTLTQGAPIVRTVDPLGTHDADTILQLAAAVEQQSEHPLGYAIVRAAVHLDIPAATNFRAIPGVGVEGTVDGRLVRVAQDASEHTDRIGTVVTVTVDGEPIGTIVLDDALRSNAAAVVERLSAVTTGRVHLLTGDNDATAREVATQTGIAQVLPQDKADVVRGLQASGTAVMVVGDGVNDAPALATASVGVAMGRHGSDLALDTADAIIIRDDLSAIPNVITLSRRARRFVIANLIIAGTFIATLVLWDLIGTLPLPLAVAGHEGSTVIVALNGLRLLRRSAWN